MKKRIIRRLYFVEQIGRRDGHLQYYKNDDGTLFSGVYKTKIRPEDLPEWYLFGRYYKRFGYMSAKGITDMVYIPNRFSNHYLKDDFLMISYGGKLKEVTEPVPRLSIEKYDGWHEYVWGSEIVTMLRGARKFSGIDISPFIEQLKRKKVWLQAEFPDEFGPGRWDVDVEKMFEEQEND